MCRDIKVKHPALSRPLFFLKEPNKGIIFLFLVFAAFFFSAPLCAEPSISVILSREMIPYQTALKGIKSEIQGFRITELSLEEKGSSEERLLGFLQEAHPELIVAVGPEAAYLVKDLEFSAPRIFTMILNPEKLFKEAPPFPGVSINHPPSRVMAGLRAALPERKKVGIFSSPDASAPLVAQYAEAGQENGLSVLSFPINSITDLRATLQSEQFAPEVVLFVPDPTIIKEKIVSYLIQECLFRNIPTVGFNAWFARSGALMGFYLDFRDIGEQTGELALSVLAGKETSPGVQVPRQLRVILNLKIAKKFGFAVSEDVRAAADQVIE
jgi:ABC-type uncharacterized transport system substrate-binding protein